jgi:hypothetical protein
MGRSAFGQGRCRRRFDLWGRSGYTTHSSYPQSATARITLPDHPYRDQRVDVVRVSPGDDPDLLVRLPDNSYLVLAMSSTDYLGSPSDPPPEESPPPAFARSRLLHPAGLRRMAQLVTRMREAATPAREPAQAGAAGAPTAAPAGAGQGNP